MPRIQAVEEARVAVSSNDLIRVDRRRYPRLHLVSELEGRVVPLQLGVRVLDISASGFAVQSLLEFEPGTTHEFQFATLRQPRPTVRARVVHARRVTPRRGRAFFVAGFAFIDLSEEARDVIDVIVADASSADLGSPACESLPQSRWPAGLPR